MALDLGRYRLPVETKMIFHLNHDDYDKCYQPPPYQNSRDLEPVHIGIGDNMGVIVARSTIELAHYFNPLEIP